VSHPDLPTCHTFGSPSAESVTEDGEPSDKRGMTSHFCLDATHPFEPGPRIGPAPLIVGSIDRPGIISGIGTDAGLPSIESRRRGSSRASGRPEGRGEPRGCGAGKGICVKGEGDSVVRWGTCFQKTRPRLGPRFVTRGQRGVRVAGG
jgi:hypothetical protein